VERLYLNSGYAYTQAGNIDAAVMVYYKLLQNNPASDMAFQLLLQLLYQENRYEEAITLIDGYVNEVNLESKRLTELERVKTELTRRLAEKP